MAKKEFRATLSEDYVILEDGQVYGTLRVRPSAVLWKPKGSHSWFRLSIEEFGTLAQKHGTAQNQ